MEKPRPRTRPPPLNLGGLADELKKLPKRGSAYYSEALGRYHELTQEEEEEEHWKELNIPREHGNDIDATCIKVRNKLMRSGADPISPSLKPAILKIMAALEKATIELRKYDPDWGYDGPLQENLPEGFMVPIEVEDDLFGKLLGQTPQSTTAESGDEIDDLPASDEGTITIGISPGALTTSQTDRQHDSNSKGKETSKITSRIVHAVDKNITSKIHNRIGPSPTKAIPTGRKSPNPMAAMASKLAFAQAKKEHTPSEPKRVQFLKTRRNVSDTFTKFSSPLVSDVQVPSPEKKAADLASESTLKTPPFRKRSQSDVHDTRRFSFLPGDDAQIATFAPY